MTAIYLNRDNLYYMLSTDNVFHAPQYIIIGSPSQSAYILREYMDLVFCYRQGMQSWMGCVLGQLLKINCADLNLVGCNQPQRFSYSI